MNEVRMSHRIGKWATAVRKRLWLMPVLASLAWTGSTLAQGPGLAPQGRPLPTKSYMNKNNFYLPVMIDERVRANLKEVLLYVKDGPTKAWTLAERGTPSQTWFAYRAPQEGEFWFNVVTVDKNGRSVPADVNQEGPGLIVVLDTQAPQLDLVPQTPIPEGQVVACEVRDTHADAAKTRFFYQTGDKVWRPLDPIAGQPHKFCIPSQAMTTGQVRASATDHAGNTTTREINLANLPTPTAPALGMNRPEEKTVASIPQPLEQVTNPGTVPALVPPVMPSPPAPTGPVARAEVDLPPLPSETRVNKVAPPRDNVVREEVVQEPSLPPPLPLPTAKVNRVPAPNLPPLPETFTKKEVTPRETTARNEAPPANRQIVNMRRVVLEYQIEQMGASGVGKVEVYLTRDRGQSWQKYCEDADKKSPLEVDLPGEGLYGIALVVSNGRGFGANPPIAGDTPDWWVEIDVTKPIADLVQVQPGVGEDSGTLLISWSARDRNLGQTPIDLYYSAGREGPWEILARGLKNDGQYRWIVPADLGAQAFLRLAVTDQAGNTSYGETPQPVALDDGSRPRVRVTGVATTTLPPPVVPQGN